VILISVMLMSLIGRGRADERGEPLMTFKCRCFCMPPTTYSRGTIRHLDYACLRT